MVLSRLSIRVFCWLSSVVLAGLLGYYYAGFRSSRSGPQVSSASLADHGATLPMSHRLIVLSPGPIAPGTDEEKSWQRLASSTRTPKTEREQAASLESLGAKDHVHAMARALAEPNLRLRELFRNAVLRGWASTAPDAALEFAMHLSETDNRPAIRAVLVGASEIPENALRLARYLTSGDSPLAKEYGLLAIAALSESGEFESATRFAAGGPADLCDEWLNEAFSQWSEHDPAAALRAFEGITNPEVRSRALQGLVNGWAEANPVGLAEYAWRLPAGADRALALGRALPNWVTLDPIAASEWLNSRGEDPNLDVGISSVAMMPSLVAHRPEVAVEWAQSITDVTMRAGALRSIAEQWSHDAPAAFRQWLERNPNLSTSDRQALADGAAPTLSTGGML